MIFLSHNKQDKIIVRQIAETFEKVFGREKVFYDEWSIQPGDSITGKMNEGLEQCNYFFFFVSRNSLNSKMVEIEWQSALMKKAQKNITFIPVKLDDAIMPAIIASTLYIDLFTQGLEIATRQMLDVVRGQNTYRPSEKVSNLIAEVVNKGQNALVEIKALYYMEPHSRYLVVVDNNEEDLSWKLPDFNEYISGFNKNINFSNGQHNCILIEVQSATSPHFPIKIQITAKDNNKVNILYIMHASSRRDFVGIPIKIMQEEK